ncbi:site-2 protease family protein [Candidatus Saccharibacteria bacterium]|nr:site-2 protease family protein [Candidatus Saccharibacteria bacterium]
MNIGALAAVFLVTVFSMMLHEVAHGFVAYKLGDETARLSGRLTLNPLKHIDPWMTIGLPLLLAVLGGPVFGGAKPVPINTRNLKFGEWGFALVAIAGPLTNFLLALIFFLVGHYTGWMLDSGFLGALMRMGVSVNLGFMLFNIIPIPPLDGSRVLYALAPEGARRIMEGMERYGVMIMLVLVWVFGGVFSNYMVTAQEWILGMFQKLVGLG